jgi:hypothetical protein
MSANANLSIFTIAENAKEINQNLYGTGGSNPMFDIRVKENESTTFIIRVLPYVKDIMKSKIQKFFYAVPNGTNTSYFDSMTTFNKPQIGEWHFCSISHIWMLLEKNPDPNVKKLSEQLRRQVALVSYVQVVNCPAKHELNGKFMPMKLPIELDKKLRELAEPNEAAKALGKLPITAYDLFQGVNLECTITGHTQFGTVMRKWSVVPQAQSELQLPLGPNSVMTPVSQLPQDQILAYFEENQTLNLEEVYGYKQPSFETRVSAYNWVRHVCGFVPGMLNEIDLAFPDVVQFHKEQSVGAMNQNSAPIETKQAEYAQPASAGNPMEAQPAPAVETPAPVATEAQAAPVATEAQAAPVATEAQAAPVATEAQAAPVETAAPAASVVIP